MSFLFKLNIDCNLRTKPGKISEIGPDCVNCLFASYCTSLNHDSVNQIGKKNDISGEMSPPWPPVMTKPAKALPFLFITKFIVFPAYYVKYCGVNQAIWLQY